MVSIITREERYKEVVEYLLFRRLILGLLPVVTTRGGCCLGRLLVVTVVCVVYIIHHGVCIPIRGGGAV